MYLKFSDWESLPGHHYRFLFLGEHEPCADENIILHDDPNLNSNCNSYYCNNNYIHIFENINNKIIIYCYGNKIRALIEFYENFFKNNIIHNNINDAKNYIDLVVKKFNNLKSFG